MSDSLIHYLHLSDFHVGKDEYTQLKMFEYIIEHIQKQFNNGVSLDFIFITGDIANYGKEKEYETFNEKFLLVLLEMLEKNGWHGKIYIVPGNHDINRGRVKYINRDDICKSGSKFFDATQIGREERQTVLQGIEAYIQNDICSDALAKNWLDSPQGTFIKTHHIRESSIGIVGINTTWLSKDNNDRHNLSPGIYLVEEALREIKDCEIRIVLGHHPLDWFLDKEIAIFQRIFGEFGVIYLHGHLHEAAVSVEEDSAGKGFLRIKAGAAYQGRDDE